MFSNNIFLIKISALTIYHLYKKNTQVITHNKCKINYDDCEMYEKFVRIKYFQKIDKLYSKFSENIPKYINNELDDDKKHNKKNLVFYNFYQFGDFDDYDEFEMFEIICEDVSKYKSPIYRSQHQPSG